ncbi:TonB-dependent receptor [Dysgonomonas sp. 25]|uniref:SusC/RagA family TonB-linked outer membrane protein n=1 Tax=Dysgonomonas sp. 25 TaxID=2302933 RepID=UPI0013D87D24|nr:TonB-dependent receptor [Dysgonomonas sp. 25]NDV67320.1 TonB-dependent receptor [Dysgonomonas sp. 25]
MKRKIYTLLLFFCMLPISLLAQDISILGTVTEASTMEPLLGATVRIKGKNAGTFTDIDGKYSIEAKQGDILVFSLVGMKSVERTVNGSGPIDVAMDNDNTMLDQVVVIGYGTVKKSHLSGAVNSLTAKELNGQVASNAAVALQGKIPGVSVSSTSGDPNSKMSINVRGISSLSNNDPLYVIDGAIGDISIVDPTDIESIEILKDAASAAIYGFRAAGGVILISTKSGRKETPTKLDLNIFTGFSSMNKKLKVFNGEEYSRFARYYNLPADGYGAEAGAVPFVGKGTDWQDVMYNTAMIYKANINLSGGSSTSTYNFSAGYLNKEGILRNTDHESYNVRLKNDFSLLNNRLTIGETMIVRMSKGHGNVSETSTLGILQYPSVLPVFDATNMNGYATSKDLNSPNPYGEAYLFDRRTQDTEFFMNAYAQAEIIEGLKYKFSVGVRRNYGKQRYYTHAYDLGTYGKNERPDLAEASSNYQSWLLENTLNYERTFGLHDLTAMVGYSAQKDKFWGMTGSNSDIPEYIGVMPGTGSSIEATSYINQLSLISQFARVMYSFDNRYLLSTSIRRDGSSRFANGHKFGCFPSVSAGWNIHEESFFSPLRNTVDQLKLRLSYGVLGNQEMEPFYPTQGVVADNMNYLQGGKIWFGQLPYVRPVSPANLKWEKSETYNLGLDLNLWNGALSLTADAYIKNTNDVLLPVPFAPSSGIEGYAIQNVGQVRNTGIELAINHRGKIGKEFNYYVGGNITTGKNKVTKVTLDNGSLNVVGYKAHGAAEQGITLFSKGHPIGFFNLIETDGIFRSQEEIDNHRDKNGKLIQPGAQVGDVRYKDHNGDGVINTDDQHEVGSPFPDMTFGLRLGGDWKGIDFNLFFDGMTGNDIYNYPRYVLESSNYNGNHSTRLANSWRPDNQNTNIPRFSKVDGVDNGWAYTDRWLEDGSYLRLKTLDIGYSLPAKWLKSIKLEHVRVYTSMENLFTLTKYSGYSPDLGESEHLNVSYRVLSRGVDEGRYPQQRTISFGIQVKL